MIANLRTGRRLRDIVVVLLASVCFIAAVAWLAYENDSTVPPVPTSSFGAVIPAPPDGARGD